MDRDRPHRAVRRGDRLWPLLAAALVALAGCDAPGTADGGGPRARLELLGTVREPALDEISGIVALPGGDFVVHNDDGPAVVYVIARNGTLRARIGIGDPGVARNKDWEDLAIVPGPDGPLLAIGDIGDNLGVRRSVRLYFTPLPAPDADGRWPERLPLVHALQLRYIDGARDAEALAYDPAGRRLLLISKRDAPPRIYGLALDEALSRDEALLDFLGELTTLRPPSTSDLLRDPVRGTWVSQPTGLAISADGVLAAVLTYRSLYVFRRGTDQDWLAAFGNTPVEWLGPPGTHDEAVAFDAVDSAGDAATGIVVTTEGVPAPLYRMPVESHPAAQPGSTP